MTKVLLIDDDPVSIFTVEILVKKVAPETNFESFREADVALQAVLSQIKNEETPDVMFVDLNMPIMDGWEFLAELESHTEHLKSTRIFVLSSSVNPADKDRARACHLVEDYIVKPIEKDQLKSLIGA